MDDVDQLVGGQRSRIISRRARINHMFPNVIFDDLRNEAIQGSSTRGRLLQHIGAFLIGSHRSFNCLDLPAQPLEAIQELGFFVRDVTHTRYISLQ